MIRTLDWKDITPEMHHEIQNRSDMSCFINPKTGLAIIETD